ncbi:hypothetical protein ABEW34_07440 [Paenibacillus algorifonticola]|uniref:hypothetical protein n=1 Tax=Paenibacillus algorifonticola TaxID=684063 RepID=UPI003D27CB83
MNNDNNNTFLNRLNLTPSYTKQLSVMLGEDSVNRFNIGNEAVNSFNVGNEAVRNFDTKGAKYSILRQASIIDQEIFNNTANAKEDIYTLGEKLKTISASLNALLSTINLMAGGLDMSAENLSEIKLRVEDINKSLNKLTTDVAVIDERIKNRFDSLDKSIADIKNSIAEIKAPVTTLSSDSIEFKKDIESIKAKQADSVTNKKWLLTTILSGASVLGVILKFIIK